MDVGNVPAMVNRVTYTGDLGYEIWVTPEYQRRLYQAILAAGREHGLVHFGMRALLSLRLEKNFPTWFRELRPIYGAFEGDVETLRRLRQRRLHWPRCGAQGKRIGRRSAAHQPARRGDRRGCARR